MQGPCRPVEMPQLPVAWPFPLHYSPWGVSFPNQEDWDTKFRHFNQSVTAFCLPAAFAGNVMASPHSRAEQGGAHSGEGEPASWMGGSSGPCR